MVALQTAPDHECLSMTDGYDYWGSKHTTVSGRECQSWSASSPHKPWTFVIDSNFPQDGSVAAAAGNKCRNPEYPDYVAGVWCYTMDPDKRWEACYVPPCPGKDIKVSLNIVQNKALRLWQLILFNLAVIELYTFGFYRAMHYSAKHGLAITCRPSLRLYATLVDCDHIGWTSLKIISGLI